MGSFQQIIMGIICLAAAFWFGSHLQDRPIGQDQAVALLPDGTIDPTQVTAQPTLLEQTKGFVSSLFESPAKPKPITVNDLRQRSLSAVPNLTPLDNSASSYQSPAGPLQTPALPAMNTSVREDLQASINGTSDNGIVDGSGVQRLVGNFVSDQSMLKPVQPVETPVVQKVAIVPDFSSLAEEVNRGLSFNDVQTHRPASQQQSPELIPVPKFSDTQLARSHAAMDADWESMRQQVATAEQRLTSYRDEMTQPIPKIADSVTQQTNKFWDRQQSEARRQQSSLTSEKIRSDREQHLKPESWADKKSRWDVFPVGGGQQHDVQQPSQQSQMHQQPMQQPQRRDYQAQPRRQPLIDRQARVTPTQFNSQPAQQNATRSEIVEVDRGFVTPIFPREQPVASRTQPTASRVRSLNDDRDAMAFTSPDSFVSNDQWGNQPTSNRVAMQRPQGAQFTQRPEMRNELRPEFNRNAGSKPEFVSPPEHRRSDRTAQGPSTSELVEAAKVTYGSFREYETRNGDTLQTISKEFYGTPDYYYDLYLANRALLSNPATVPPGMTLKIPRFDAR